jgi:hypothetical protein
MSSSQNKGASASDVIAAVLGLFAGFATLIYVGGAALLALRLVFAGMAAPAIFASQISRELVVSMGLTRLLLPMLIVAGIYLALRLLRGYSERRLIGGWWWLLWMVAGTFILAAPGFWYHVVWSDSHPNEPRLFWPWWWTALVFLLPLLAIVVALRTRQGLLTRSFRTRALFNTPKALVTMTALWSLTALPGALILGSAAPFELVAVCNQGEEISGLYVGQSTDRLFIGEGVNEKQPTERRVLSLGLDDTDAVFVGRDEGDCDHPAILPPDQAVNGVSS